MNTNDFAEYWQEMKSLHREYYQARLQNKLDEAIIISSKLSNVASKLVQTTVQESLKKRAEKAWDYLSEQH